MIVAPITPPMAGLSSFFPIVLLAAQELVELEELMETAMQNSASESQLWHHSSRLNRENSETASTNSAKERMASEGPLSKRG